MLLYKCKKLNKTNGITDCHIVPIMTSATAPAPVSITSNTTHSASYPAWWAFNGTANTAYPNANANGVLYTINLGVSVSVDKIFIKSAFRSASQPRVVRHIKAYIGESSNPTQCALIGDVELELDNTYAGIAGMTDTQSKGTILHILVDEPVEHRPQVLEIIPIGRISSVEETSIVRLNATMTSATAPWGIVTGTNTGGNNTTAPFQAFANRDDRHWYSYYANEYINYELPIEMRIKKIRVKTSAGASSTATEELNYSLELRDRHNQLISANNIITKVDNEEIIEFDGGIVARQVRIVRHSGDAKSKVVYFSCMIDGYTVKVN